MEMMIQQRFKGHRRARQELQESQHHINREETGKIKNLKEGELEEGKWKEDRD